MRILLADGHPPERTALRRLLEALPGIEVVGEATDGAEVLDLALTQRPDVVILDRGVTAAGDVDTTTALRQHLPGVAVLAISNQTDATHVRQALDAGARGFMVKSGAAAELALALHAVAAGHVFLSPCVSRAVLSGSRSAAGVRALSPRQTEILRALAQGHTTKEIAARLSLSVKTVETHRARMMEALGLRNANQLVRYAVQHASDLAA